MKKNVLHIFRGATYDTATGHDEIIDRHGPYSYIVHHFDHAGIYQGATYMTHVEIILAIEGGSGVHYNKLIWN